MLVVVVVTGVIGITSFEVLDVAVSVVVVVDTAADVPISPQDLDPVTNPSLDSIPPAFENRQFSSLSGTERYKNKFTTD